MREIEQTLADDSNQFELEGLEAEKFTAKHYSLSEAGEFLNAVIQKTDSFNRLDEEHMRILSRLPPPTNMEDGNLIEQFRLQIIERKRQLLFSVPFPDHLEKDRDEAWNILDAKSFFNEAQNQYVIDLIRKYADATQLERLVIWRLVKLRMDSGIKRGSATAEDELKIKLARFLLSAFEIEKDELFEAATLKSSMLGEEEHKMYVEANEQIMKLYQEKADKAHDILESHFSLDEP